MALAEDFAAFFADFGLPCTAGGQSFTAILDQPDDLLDLQRVSAHSRQYDLTYITGAVVLARDMQVQVDGLAYVVREAPRQVDDGSFSTVRLSLE